MFEIFGFERLRQSWLCWTIPAVALVLGACSSPPSLPEESDPSPPSEQASSEKPWFEEITSETGLEFLHSSRAGIPFFFPEHIGSGAALFDYDDDGDLDIYLVQSGPPPAKASVATNSNRLFRQEADGRFVDRTAEAGLLEQGYGMGTAVGDYDGDGDLDLFVTNYDADALYRNNGDGSFTDVTAIAEVGSELWSTSACFFDGDGDLDLDLFVVTYVDHQPIDKVCTDRAGRPEFCGPAAFRAVPDLYYRNEGDGTFSDMSAATGIATVDNRGLGVACLDLDGDHRQDVFVANDGEPNQLWINRGDGRLEESGVLLGVATNALGKPEASMGVALGDVDGDHDIDFFLTHLDRETNTLYLNLGRTDLANGFEDATGSWNLGPESLAYTGFGAGFWDADHDGDLDLLIANGRVRRGPPLLQATDLESATGGSAAVWHEYAEPNLFFLNESNRGFRLAAIEAGDLVGRIEVSRGLVFGDVDLDGDLDVLLTNGNGPVRLYRNDRGHSHSWLEWWAPGHGGALGAVVTTRAGDSVQTRPLTTAYSYLVGGPPTVHFGLDDAEQVNELSIRWPNGEEQTWNDLPSRRRLTIHRSGRVER